MSTQSYDEAFSFLPKQDDSNESSRTLISPVISWSPVLPKSYTKTGHEHASLRDEIGSIPKQPRKIWSAATLSLFALDTIIALLAVYFIAFAIAAYSYNGRSIAKNSGSITALLLQGAKIVSRFCTTDFSSAEIQERALRYSQYSMLPSSVDVCSRLLLGVSNIAVASASLSSS